ncbi:MAG: hypothetical protein N4A50_04115 [Vallitalea sp.]|nr:hypothetical protein [Vallitalea sp.]
MKKIGIIILLAVIINLMGCQNKEVTNEELSQNVEQENNDNKPEGIDNSEDSTENSTENPMKQGGSVIILPEGIDMPEGATEVKIDNLQEKTAFIPEGMEIPEGSKVLFSTNGEFGEMGVPQFDTTITNERKEEFKKIFPELCEDIRKILIDNSKLIDSQFDMKSTQILLVSNAIHTAYLINSQNEKYGEKDELIEYSTDTIKDTSILVQGFNIIQFNDKPTYIVSLDFMLQGYSISGIKEDLIKFIVHEAIHLVMQKAKDPDLKTQEETMATRAIKYPLNYQSRIDRAQMLELYKKALKTKDNEEKINYIKEANYFYNKFLEYDEDNKAKAIYDKIEGEAKFAEFQSIAILNNAKTKEEVNQEASKLLIEYYTMFNYEAIDENLEYYIIGSMAYALIYELNEDKVDSNPVNYLFNKYGIIENEGDKKLEQTLNIKYSDENKRIKKRVDSVTDKLNSDDYTQIVIPVYHKYEENANVIFNQESIQYVYNGEKVTIDNITKEVRLKNSRILLKSVESLSNSRNMVNIENMNDDSKNYIVIIIPKEDIEVNNDRLTVQTKNIQMYDVKFINKNGKYYLQDK